MCICTMQYEIDLSLYIWTINNLAGDYLQSQSFFHILIVWGEGVAETKKMFKGGDVWRWFEAKKENHKSKVVS